MNILNFAKYKVTYKEPTTYEKFRIFMHDSTNLDDPSYTKHQMSEELLQLKIVKETL